MEIGKETLRMHNEKIIKLIMQSPEYRKREIIRQLYENLMSKIEPLKEKCMNDYKRKWELYTNQYLAAERAFLNRIMKKNWPKIEEEL